MPDDDIFRICRLCLKSGDWEVDVFNPKGTKGFLVWIIMKELVEIQASQGDGLPRTICNECMKKLSDWKHFKFVCTNSRIEFLKFQINSGLVEHREVLEDDIFCKCRLCLKYGDWEIDVMDPKGTNGLLLWVALKELLEIQVYQGDGLPHTICNECMENLSKFRQFKTMCINSWIEFLKFQMNSGLVESCENGGLACPSPSRNSIPEHSCNLVEVNSESGNNEGSREAEDLLDIGQESLSPIDPLCQDDVKSEVILKTERGSTDESLNSGDLLSFSDPVTQDDAKTNVTEVSDHDAIVESSCNEEEGTGSSIGGEDQGAISEQDCGTIDTLRRQIQSRRRGGGGSQSCFGRPTLRKRITCLECGSSFACKFSLSTHICIDRRGRRDLNPEIKGDLSQRIEDDTKSLHSNDQEVFGICDDLHVRKRGEEFICDHCRKVYTLRVHLISHLRSVHLNVSDIECKVTREMISCQTSLRAFAKKNEAKREKKFTCSYCGKGFLTKLKLLRHIVPVHLRPKTFGCKICSHNFTRKSELKEHIISVHVGEKRHECEECGKDFKSAVLLKSHMLTHLKTRPHPCTLCPRSFLFKGGLKSHMASHSGRNHTCEVCGKKFCDVNGLRQHMLRHSDERPFQCKECPKSFKTSGDLSVHSFVHSGIRRHTCGVCGKKFCQSYQLNSHMRTHDGKRPYECKICHKTFGTNSTLYQHVARHGERSHECELCHKLFKTKNDLNGHVLIHGPKNAEKRLKCAECSKTFHRKSPLIQHMTTHTELRPYVCGVCSMAFKTKNSLRQHDKVHNEKREGFECKLCHKQFCRKPSLQRHMACHCERRNDCEMK